MTQKLISTCIPERYRIVIKEEFMNLKGEKEGKNNIHQCPCMKFWKKKSNKPFQIDQTSVKIVHKYK